MGVELVVLKMGVVGLCTYRRVVSMSRCPGNELVLRKHVTHRPV